MARQLGKPMTKEAAPPLPKSKEPVKMKLTYRLTTAIIAILLLALPPGAGAAPRITVRSEGRPAAEVFAEIARQSGKNFIYTSDVLNGVDIHLDVRNENLRSALRQMFLGTDVEFKIKGNNILLSKRKKVYVYTPTGEMFRTSESDPRNQVPDTVKVGLLREVEVTGSPNQTLAMASPHIGALNISRAHIARTPALLGESDVVKALQLEPGISAGVEGMAGMYVHGGNQDENLYMLDNIPLYQVNHFGGLFSAFNTEAISNVDFYKSTFPAKFDGRLSSYMDVYTRDGSFSRFSGSGRLGLTSGSLHLEGPLWKGHTAYSVSLRRSWFDVLTLPICAIVNSTKNEGDSKENFGYAFTDLNAKITHRFSPTSKVYAMFYYGNDYLSDNSRQDEKHDGYWEDDSNRMRWGNIVASVGWVKEFTPTLYGRISGAYTRYGSMLSTKNEDAEYDNGERQNYTYSKITTRNNISDWILRGDFEWNTSSANAVNFGAAATFHSFLPQRTDRRTVAGNMEYTARENAPVYHARELNIYAEDNLLAMGFLRLSAGVHYSLFNISGTTKHALSPRLGFNLSMGNVALKGGYSRTAQFVHQLAQSSISMPTDQWVPVIGDQKAQSADKISLGAYWNPRNLLTISVEGYWKWMHNLTDYMDEYYLLPPSAQWDMKLCEGRGWAKGIDFKVSKEFGSFRGQVSYSLLWADRQFPQRNGGRKYPARYDNRHKINILADWKINDKWEIAASWTGMSGNRVTLPLQCWQDPGLGPFNYNMFLRGNINNYRLPFYHRLDLSATRHTAHGYWTFSLYNAYCHINTIGVRLDYSDTYIFMNPDDWSTVVYSRPEFQKIRLIPIIPSISYTWLF